MTDASSSLGASAAETADPLAVDPGAGTDAVRAMLRPLTAQSSPPAVDRSAKPFWARLDSPFTVGFLLTLGGLVGRSLLGVALINISTIVIYIVFAMFAALGLDPVVKWLGRHNVKRAWAIVIVFLPSASCSIGLILLVVPTLVAQIGAFITGIPADDHNFEKSDFSTGWRGSSAPASARS